MSVKEIKTVQINPDLVERCKALLKDAESGELQGIIGVVIYENGNAADFWVSTPKNYHLSVVSDRIIGCLERIKYQMFSYRYDINIEDIWTN